MKIVDLNIAYEGDKTMRTTYNKLIGKIGDEYYFLDDTFTHSDSFKGATGTVLRPVSRSEYEETKTVEGLKDRDYAELWKNAVSSGETVLGLYDWLEIVLEDGDDAIWDLSGIELWEQLREIGLSGEEYPVFECTGGGRSFSKDMKWDELYNPELWKEIQKYE